MALGIAEKGGVTMRVAALYDIHGNLPALEAVLSELDDVAPDTILVGGDIVSGPLPTETLERLLALGDGAAFIRGNADREVIELAADAREPREGGLNDRWVGEQLARDRRDFLGGLLETLVLDVDGLGPTLFCHGSPRRDEEILTRISPLARVRTILAGVEQRVVVCGHTHVQFDRSVGDHRLMNAGSVGMPYERAPGAYWALLGPDVQLRRTEYDVDGAAERIRASGYPGADEFAREQLLDPPSAEEASEFFERLAREEGA